MEYKNTCQARFSNDYLLVLGEDETGAWNLLINGPRPVRSTLSSLHCSDAQSEAYSVAARYFVEKGIVDPRLRSEQIAWVAYP
jgi:hypothetical protein